MAWAGLMTSLAVGDWIQPPAPLPSGRLGGGWRRPGSILLVTGPLLKLCRGSSHQHQNTPCHSGDSGGFRSRVPGPGVKGQLFVYHRPQPCRTCGLSLGKSPCGA